MFADRIFGDPQITERLHAGVHYWVQYERDNMCVPQEIEIIIKDLIEHLLIIRPDHALRPIIHSFICHLDTHGRYSSVFESYYLRITAEFYAAESLQKASTLNAQEFLKHCALRGTEEDARSRHVLPESSWGSVKMATERSLLDGRLTWLAKEGIRRFRELTFPETMLTSICDDPSDRCADEGKENRWTDQDVWPLFP